MSERLKVFGMVLKKNLVVITAFMILLGLIVFARFSTFNVYANEMIASVECRQGLVFEGEFVESNQESFYIGGLDSKLNNIADSCQNFDGTSSICCVYTIENICQNTITVYLDYNKNNTKNFVVSYSFDEKTQNLSNEVVFVVRPEEQKTIKVFVDVGDLSLDAYLDGTLNLVVSAIGGEINEWCR